jgi:hypothetical protein
MKKLILSLLSVVISFFSTDLKNLRIAENFQITELKVTHLFICQKEHKNNNSSEPPIVPTKQLNRRLT